MNNDTDQKCLICGEELSEKYAIDLQCNHSYHYECLQTSLTYLNNNGNNRCLYCNKSFGLLPVVNGLKSLKYGIHWIDNHPNMKKKRFVILF